MSEYIRRAQRPDGHRPGIVVAQRAAGTVAGAVRTAGKPLARYGFPYRKPSPPTGVEVPREPASLGGDYDTEWAQRPLARVVRTVLVNGPMRVAVRTIATPKVSGLDRLADLLRVEEPAPVIFTPNHHSHIDTGVMIDAIPACLLYTSPSPRD